MTQSRGPGDPGEQEADTQAVPRPGGAPSATPDVPERLRPSPGIAPAASGGPGGAGAGWSSAHLRTPGTGLRSDPMPRPAASAAPPAAATAVRRGPRRARLALKRVDPWSVLKFTFVYSTALLIVLVVAVIALYGVLSAMGVFHSIDSFLHDINGSTSTSAYLSFPKVVIGAILIGIVNVILFTALATLGAFVYNICADLVGGVEVTFTERT